MLPSAITLPIAYLAALVDRSITVGRAMLPSALTLSGHNQRVLLPVPRGRHLPFINPRCTCLAIFAMCEPGLPTTIFARLRRRRSVGAMDALCKGDMYIGRVNARSSTGGRAMAGPALPRHRQQPGHGRRGGRQDPRHLLPTAHMGFGLIKGLLYLDLEDEEMESTYPAALVDRATTDGRTMLSHRLRRAHRPRRARAHRRSGVQHRPAADRVHRYCLHQADRCGFLHRPGPRGGEDPVPARAVRRGFTVGAHDGLRGCLAISHN